jgi:hypothetical protein
MDEDKNFLVPINTMNIFMDDEGRVVIIPTSKDYYSMYRSEIIKLDGLLR